jgi:hypothetical protein
MVLEALLMMTFCKGGVQVTFGLSGVEFARESILIQTDVISVINCLRPLPDPATTRIPSR